MIWYCCYSVAKSFPTLWGPLVCSTPGFLILHYHLEFSQTHVYWVNDAQTHVYWVNDAIQPSHPLLPPFPPALKLSSIRVFQWVNSSHQEDKVLELQHQSFQWVFRICSGGGQEELPHSRGQGRRPRGATPRQRRGGYTGVGGPRGATPSSRSGGAALRRYPLSKVRSSGCTLLEQPWRDAPRPR